jgi:hypothetical protein
MRDWQHLRDWSYVATAVAMAAIAAALATAIG